jgi:hypothetical protein
VGAQGNGTTLSSFLQALQQQVANQEQQGKLLSAKA